MVRRQAVTAAEAEAWLQEFDALEQQGACAFCLTPILTEAVKLAWRGAKSSQAPDYVKTLHFGIVDGVEHWF